MSDIRINALASTATTPASDDYLALDGSANGTRKILATNIANNVTDVILGASGPSVKSTLSARAPRQGLVFDGTAGATVSVPAFGTSDFSCAFVASVNNFTNYNAFVGNTTNSGNFFFGTRSGLGDLGVIITATGSWITSGFTPTLGKTYSFVYTRSGGNTGKFYVDGILVSTVTDSANYSTALNQFGSNAGTANAWPGTIEQGLVYNRALSAAEVVALYESGAPSGADYPTQVAGTALLTGDDSTFSSGVGSWQGINGGSISASGGLGVVTTTGGYIGAGTASNLVKKGSRYRLTFTASAFTGSVTAIIVFTSDGTIYNTFTTGTSTLEFTATATSYVGFSANTAVSGGFSLDNVTLVPLGLLLAPDAAQAGGGLTWYDTSGNAANITLPASGVSWNVPSSRVLGGNWTTSGTLNVNGSTATIGDGTAGADSLYLKLNGGYTSGTNDIAGVQMQLGGVTAAKISLNELISDTYGIVFATYGSGSLNNAAAITGAGNFLVGTTTDSANGKLQLATHTTSAGGIGFGTDTSLYRAAAQSLNLDGASSPQFSLSVSGTQKARFESYTDDLYISTLTAGKSIILRSGNATTALTLDSSQNATFAGTVTSGGFKAGQNSGGYGQISWSSLWSTSGSYALVFGSSGDTYVNAASGQPLALCINGVAKLTVKSGGGINMSALPTSSSGLSAGDIWNDGGTLKIV